MNFNKFINEMYLDAYNFYWNKKKLMYYENKMTPLSVIVGLSEPKPDIVVLEIE